MSSDSVLAKQQATTCFLGLPAEIRNRIYQFLLATEYVTERNVNSKFFEPLAWMPIPSLRCHNIWIERSAYSPNILRVCRRVYQESSAIFSKNSWILVRVNHPTFAEELRGRGYNAISIDIDQGIKISTLILSIDITSLSHSAEGLYNTFVIRSSAAGILQDALLTAGRLADMKLNFIPCQNFPKEGNSITRAFSQLRGVRSASVCGPGSQNSLGVMTRAISTRLVTSPEDNDAILEFIEERLENSLSRVEEYQDKKCWSEAADECLASIAYVDNCYVVYVGNIIGDPARWDLVLRGNAKYEAFVDAYRDLLVKLQYRPYNQTGCDYHLTIL